MNKKPKRKKRECNRGHRGCRIINDELFKASVTAPLLKRVTTSKGKQLLKDIHEGSCGSHNRRRALVGKSIQTRVLLANNNQ